MRAFAIVPAAGLSQRMGEPKLLLPWNGAAVIDAVMERWRASPVERIVVVVRKGDLPLQERLRREQFLTPPPVELVLPAVDPPDMKTSVREALAHLRSVAHPAPDDVWLMAPADMPRLSSRVIASLVEAAERFPGEILVPRAAGRRGHPVLFPFAFADHVERLGPHEGLNRLLERLPTRACEWPAGAADEALPGDLDTPADYAQALAALRASPRSHSDQAVSGGAVDSDGSRC